MKTEVEAAFTEMLDISKDIDKAVLFAPGEVLASNVAPGAEAAAVAQAEELVALGEERACDMGSQPLTQLVVETPAGFVFLARDTDPAGMTILVTGKKNSRVGLVLYDLKTCLRDAREALGAAGAQAAEGEEV
jgi:predicted regulator of Ras-like GTPase activity (Roadblock/LC7/MglB family)